jgi:5'-nucleotidase
LTYDLSNKLVIGVASSAVFDLSDSDQVFKQQGEEAYRRFQEKHLNDPLKPGIAFPFVSRLLSLNDLTGPDSPLVEVILLSRNDPDTGLRVMKSIEHHKIAISRAIFTQGLSPYQYIPALNISLFLSANQLDVQSAIKAGYPAGHVLDSVFNDDESDIALRIAFDFDGVLASGESEAVYQKDGLSGFVNHEVKNAVLPHSPGPLKNFLVGVSKIQSFEESHKKTHPDYLNRIRVSIVTARNAPAHERALYTLKSWGVMVNDAFFLGGIDKASVLSVLKPHIFFDDQVGHVNSAREVVPSVHVPFGEINERS